MSFSPWRLQHSHQLVGVPLPDHVWVKYNLASILELCTSRVAPKSPKYICRGQSILCSLKIEEQIRHEGERKTLWINQRSSSCQGLSKTDFLLQKQEWPVLNSKIIHQWFSQRLKEVLSSDCRLLPDSWQPAGLSAAATEHSPLSNAVWFLTEIKNPLNFSPSFFFRGVFVRGLDHHCVFFSIPFLRLPLCDCRSWTDQYLKTCRAWRLVLLEERRSYKNNVSDRKHEWSIAVESALVQRGF